ncbi:MAG: non-canonical purine NTP pyrophosphatase [Patescibacteria group bacterium]
MIYFITGNKDKFNEAKAIIPELEQLEIDLPEIQSLDPHEVIRAKLEAAKMHHSGDFVVEDTSVELECLNGFPGPLVKSFLSALGTDGITGVTKRYEDNKVTARTIIGFMSGEKVEFFEGSLKGQIVHARGDQDFAWGPIFQPDGYNKTFGEMSREEKNSISMRGVAFRKLRDYLEKL